MCTHIYVYIWCSYTDTQQSYTYMYKMWIVGLCACKKSWLIPNDFICIYTYRYSAEFSMCIKSHESGRWLNSFDEIMKKKRTYTHRHTVRVRVYICTRVYSYTLFETSQPANNSAIQNEPLSHGQTFYSCTCVHVYMWIR